MSSLVELGITKSPVVVVEIDCIEETASAFCLDLVSNLVSWIVKIYVRIAAVISMVGTKVIVARSAIGGAI